MKPLVSVCLLSWNHSAYIEQCLHSLDNQVFKDFEIIYLDNHSKDSTFEIALEFSKTLSVPFYGFKNVEPKSLTQNINILFSKASGKYITILSTDDWLSPNSLFERVNFYEKNQHLGLVFSSGWVYYTDLNNYEEVSSVNFQRGKVFEKLLENNFVFTPSVIFKRSVIEDVGGWDENLKIEDFDMWLKISLKYEIDFISKPLVYYRRHSGNFSQFNNLDFLESILMVYDKYNYKNNPIVKEKLLYYKHFYICAMAEQNDSIVNVTNAFIKYFSFNIKYIRPYLSFLLKRIIQVQKIKTA